MNHTGKTHSPIIAVDKHGVPYQAPGHVAAVRDMETHRPTLTHEQQKAEIEKAKKEFLQKESEKTDVNKSRNIDKFRFSYIEEYEEEEAIRQVEEALGFPRMRPPGYMMAVKVYVRPEDIHEFVKEDGTKGFIALPESVSGREKWSSCVALVLAQGPDAYAHPKFNGYKWCKIGDWIVFPRNAGTQVNYRGIPIQYIPDDTVLDIVADPSWVTRD